LPQFLKTEGIRLVHINMHVAIGVLLAARKAGIPVVVHYRAKTNDRPALFFDLFLPWLYKRAGAVLCISQVVANHFVKRGLKENVSVLYNPIDFESFLGQDQTPIAVLQNIKEKKI